MGKFVRHEPCPKCMSKDNLARYDDGSSYCFTSDCNYRETPANRKFPTRKAPKEPSMKPYELKGTIGAISNRGISKATCEKYGVTQETGADGTITRHHYPIVSKDTGRPIGAKTRFCARKDFISKGSQEGAGLFGQQTCRGGGKYITITEGELDALSVSEMFDNRWDVVSIRNGANSAAKEIQSSLDFLETYDNVVVCFDEDAEGRKAVKAVQDLFTPGKLKIVKLPLKDAGAMLEAGKVKKFTECWWDAKVYRPDGIIGGVDTWDSLVEKRAVKSNPYPWSGLNDMTRGFRKHELVTLTSGTGMGKTQVIRELEHYLLGAQDGNIGILALEEDVSRTAMGIMSVEANKLLHLEEETPVEELRPFWEQTMGTGRFFLFDHWGSTATENLLARVRYMAKALGCEWIFLDHLSIVVSAQDNGDERKAIDEIMTKLRSLVAETGIGLFLVSHLSRQQGKGHEEGCQISLNHLRGSQAIAQLSDMVIGLERDQQNEDAEIRDTTTVRVLKNRYTGETGPCCYLKYDRETGRMSEVSKPIEAITEEF